MYIYILRGFPAKLPWNTWFAHLLKYRLKGTLSRSSLTQILKLFRQMDWGDLRFASTKKKYRRNKYENRTKLVKAIAEMVERAIGWLLEILRITLKMQMPKVKSDVRFLEKSNNQILMLRIAYIKHQQQQNGVN